MQKASKILGARLRDAYDSKQQLERQVVDESQISALEQQISDLEQGKEGLVGSRKGAVTRKQNKLKKELEVLRAGSPEVLAQLEAVNATISNIESFGVKYVRNSSDPSRGNYKFTAPAGLSRDALNIAFFTANAGIRNSYKMLRDGQFALLGDRSSLDRASAALRGHISDYKRLTGVKESKLEQRMDDFIAKEYELLNTHKHEPLFQAMQGSARSLRQHTDDSVAAARRDLSVYVDDSVADAKKYADEQVESARQDSENRYNSLSNRVGTAIKYGAAVAAVALVVGIGGYFFGPKGEQGSTGLQGPQGVAGVTVQGPKGEPGETPDLSDYVKKGDVTPVPTPDLSNYVTKTELEQRLAAQPTATATAIPQPTPTVVPPPAPTPHPGAEGLAAVQDAFRYGLSYNLARDMYTSNPAGFIAAFGVVPGAQSQLPNWFDGNAANGEVVPINGIAVMLDGVARRAGFYLTNGARATFDITAQGAKQFTLEYLANHSDRVSEVAIITPGTN